MRWMRILASVTAILGAVLASFWTIMWAALAGSRGTGLSNTFFVGILLCGPVSLIAATAVAWKSERIGGFWLVLGGVVNVALAAIWRDLMAFPVVSAVPMLLAGSLWLLYAFKGRSEAQDREA